MINDQAKATENNKEVVHELFDRYGQELPADSRKKMEEAFIKMKEEGLVPKDVFGFTPAFMEEIYGLAYNFYKTGKYQQARTLFQFLQMLDFEDVRYSFGMAACSQYLKEYKAAAASYMVCNSLDPLNPAYPFHQYHCLMKMERPIAAVQALQTALVLTERDPKYAALKEKVVMELEFMKEHLKSHVSKQYEVE